MYVECTLKIDPLFFVRSLVYETCMPGAYWQVCQPPRQRQSALVSLGDSTRVRMDILPEIPRLPLAQPPPYRVYRAFLPYFSQSKRNNTVVVVV